MLEDGLENAKLTPLEHELLDEECGALQSLKTWLKWPHHQWFQMRLMKRRRHMIVRL
jgi:hypothetical protein